MAFPGVQPTCLVRWSEKTFAFALFFWKTYFALRRAGGKTARPPHKPKQYQTTTWKRSGIRFKETLFGKTLILSLARGHNPLGIPLPKSFDIETTKTNIATINLVFRIGTCKFCPFLIEPVWNRNILLIPHVFLIFRL